MEKILKKIYAIAHYALWSVYYVPFFFTKLVSILMAEHKSLNIKNGNRKKEVILFHSHHLNMRVLKRFREIEKCCKHNYDVILLYDNSTYPFDIAANGLKYYVINNNTVKKLGYKPCPGAANYMWNNSEFGVLDFFLANPGYDYYWRIEYDVEFGGSWNAFFNYFSEDNADFIGSYIKKYEETKDWIWWDRLSPGIPNDLKISSFFAVIRFSGKALRLLDEKYRSGLYGFCEALAPTLLNLEGFKIKDIGRKWYQPSTFIHWAPLKVFQKVKKLSHPVR